ncbi:MAG: MCE family protein [Sandaracinaceae bacterium]|jgi:phospholipid/cholesterol/gamma-HCH transport system substrate-binding protein|nr:MCE family protein [Sandaracinaceae bacterium]
MQPNSKTQLRVGLFVTFALALIAFLAFVVGAQQNLFTRKTEFVAIFETVDGLRPGSVVTVAGVNVGSIDSVEFMDDGRIEVRFSVVNDAAALIRGRAGATAGTYEEGTSQVSIGSKGMLGDKLMQITVGLRALPLWDPEQPLPASTSGDLMTAASNAMAEVQGTAENLRLATDPFRDQVFSRDVARVAANVARITDMMADGNGAVQHLLTDEATAAELDATLGNLRATSDEFARTSRSIRRIAEEIERGDGTAHALIYGDEGRVALVNIGRATDEVATLLEAVRTGDGTAHDVIYGNAGEELIANLTRASDDIAAITADVRAGRGTIGGLLQDPSIYEDIKRLVGDLERNEILRALVRYSVRRDEARRPVRAVPIGESGSPPEPSPVSPLEEAIEAVDENP